MKHVYFEFDKIISEGIEFPKEKKEALKYLKKFINENIKLGLGYICFRIRTEFVYRYSNRLIKGKEKILNAKDNFLEYRDNEVYFKIPYIIKDK